MENRRQNKEILKGLLVERDQCDESKESSETEIRSASTTFANNVNSHLNLQSNVVQSLPPEVKETIREIGISSSVILKEKELQKAQSDLSDPKSEIGDLNIEREMADIKANYTISVDNIIAQSLGSLDQNLQNSAQSVRSSHQRNDEAIKTLIHHVEQGIAIEDKIDEIENTLGDSDSDSDNNSNNQGGNQGAEGQGGNNQGGNQGAEGQGGSSSLVDDFADPSLEQPSHMDPED